MIHISPVFISVLLVYYWSTAVLTFDKIILVMSCRRDNNVSLNTWSIKCRYVRLSFFALVEINI